MDRIFGYLTNPLISAEEFNSKIERIKDSGLETRIFIRGKKDNTLIGPRGIMFSGESSHIGSAEILDLFYDYGLPNHSVDGLTYDVSFSQNSSELTMPDLKRANCGDSYFAIRIKNTSEKKLIRFNDFFLGDNNRKLDFRLNGNCAVYESITTPENLHQQMENLKYFFQKEGFKLDDIGSTIIYHLYFK